MPEVAGELGVKLNYWHVMDAGRDSVHLLGRWLDSAGAQMPLVLVFNEVRGERFDQLTASGLLEPGGGAGRAHDAPAASCPTPRCRRWTRTAWSFWAAMQPGGLGLLDRQRVKLWLQRTEADLEPLAV